MSPTERRRHRDELHAQIALLDLQGLNSRAIARQLGINRNTVLAALERPVSELRALMTG